MPVPIGRIGIGEDVIVDCVIGLTVTNEVRTPVTAFPLWVSFLVY